MSYLAKYISGEYEQVWDELIEMGGAVRETPLYFDALAVAKETMSRAQYNVELIVTRLKNHGYSFEHPNYAYIPAAATQIDELDKLEARVGLLPLSVRVWYELVSDVDLSGSHHSWSPLILGNVGFLTHLSTAKNHLQGTPTEIQQFFNNITMPKMSGTGALDLAWGFLEYTGQTNSITNEPIGLIISRDDGYNWYMYNGDVADIIIPEAGIDGWFRHPDRWIAPTFVGYLRKCFAWGGFPGFANVAESLRPTEMLEYLKEGLLPI